MDGVTALSASFSGHFYQLRSRQYQQCLLGAAARRLSEN